MAVLSASSASRVATLGKLFIVVIASTLAACTAGLPPEKTISADYPDPVGLGSPASLQYGYGIMRVPGVSFQPDVVLLGGGPDAIRDASADGIQWAIDPTVPGMRDVHVGSVVVMTGRATGRVMAIEDRAGSRILTLAPVNLTEILQDGAISVDSAINASELLAQEIPGIAGTVSIPSGDGKLLFGLLPQKGPPPAPTSIFDHPLPKPLTTRGAAFSIAGLGIAPTLTQDAVGLTVSYNGPSVKNTSPGLRGEMTFTMATSHLRLDAGATVSRGRVSAYRAIVNRIKEIRVKFNIGGDGRTANRKVRIEFPFEYTAPVPPSPATAGLPLRITIGLSLIVSTALTGKDATLSGEGVWKINGTTGIRDGRVVSPKSFVVQKSLTNSIGGISLGPSGAVFAVKVKVGVGIGSAIASAGPYAFITVSTGITNGSAIGAPLVRCRSASLDILLGGGAEISVAAPIWDGLLRALPGLKLKQAAESSYAWEVRKEVVPNVPICQ